MSPDILAIAILTGAATWAFRALPILVLRREARPGGVLARFLAATGAAAIATLFAASVLPLVWSPLAQQPRLAPADLIPLIAGTAATVMAFLPRRSVVVAALAGAAAFGAAVHLIG